VNKLIVAIILSLVVNRSFGQDSTNADIDPLKFIQDSSYQNKIQDLLDEKLEPVDSAKIDPWAMGFSSDAHIFSNQENYQFYGIKEW
jgi:hypothetical protein